MPSPTQSPKQTEASPSRMDRWAVPACFIFIAWLMVMTFSDYGVSWDEYYRWQGGEAKLAYYQDLLSGDWEGAAKWRASTDHYPGFFDLSLAVARRVSPLNLVDTGHLWIALFGLAGLVGTYLVARELGGRWVGLGAVVILSCTPRFWGHLFINPKDVPFAATFILAMWALLRVLGKPERMAWRSALLFGLLAGACMSVRVGGLLLFCYAGLFLGVQALVRWRGGSFDWSVLWREMRRLLLWLLMAAVPAFTMLIAFWPNAHKNPFAATADTLGEVSSFGWQGQALFKGELLGAGEIPLNYLPTMLALTTPDFWFFVILSALVFLFVKRGAWLSPVCWRRRHALVFALLFGAAFPVGYILVKGAVVYDGIRHVLFILPMLAPLLALAVDVTQRWLRGWNRGVWITWLSGLVALLLLTVWNSVQLHPYQYTYYNQWAGGLSGVQGRYDIEYWGTAYREAVDLLVDDAEQDPELASRTEPIRVAMIPPRKAIFAQHEQLAQPPMAMVVFFLPEGFELVESEADPDYFVSIRRFGLAEMLPGDEVAQVERDGVLLARVTRSLD